MSSPRSPVLPVVVVAAAALAVTAGPRLAEAARRLPRRLRGSAKLAALGNVLRGNPTMYGVALTMPPGSGFDIGASDVALCDSKITNTPPVPIAFRATKQAPPRSWTGVGPNPAVAVPSGVSGVRVRGCDVGS